MKQNYQEDKEHIEFDNYFQEKLQGIKPEYQESLWETLESKLDNNAFTQIDNNKVDDFVRQKLSSISPSYQEAAWDNLEKQLDIVENQNIRQDKAFDNLIKQELLILNPIFQESAWDNLEKQLDSIENPLTPEDAEFDNLIKQELSTISPSYQESVWEQLEEKLDNTDKPAKTPIFKLQNWVKVAAIILLFLSSILLFITTKNYFSNDKSKVSNQKIKINNSEKNISDSDDNANKKQEYTENNEELGKKNNKETEYTTDNSGNNNITNNNNYVSGNNTNKPNTNSIIATTNTDNTNTQPDININTNKPNNTKIDNNVVFVKQEVNNLTSLSNMIEEENTYQKIDIKPDTLALPKLYTNFKYLILAGFEQQINMTRMASNSNHTLAYGISNEIRYKDRIALNAGVFYSLVDFSYKNGFNEPVTDEAGNFIDEIEYLPQTHTFNDIRVQSDVLTIPLELKYFINKKSKHKIFANIGSSSHIYLKQHFTYNLNFESQIWANESQAIVKDVSKQVGFYPFSHLNLSIGLENHINKKYALIIQPYYKAALGRLGLEQIFQDTFGIRALILFKP